MNRSEGSRPSSPTTVHSYAYEGIRNRILNGSLAPGTALIQTTLAAELNVSLTPVREALRDLATEGLVTQLPHKGTVVSAVGIDDAIEINQIRLKLEPDAIAAATRTITPNGLRAVEELFDRLTQASDGEWVALNREFHLALIAATPSDRVRGILTNLASLAALQVGAAISHRRGTGPEQEHRAILDALQQGDASKAHDEVERHLRHSLVSLEDARRAASITAHP
jgi:DNA-binding GntR family transcriptional regulator